MILPKVAAFLESCPRAKLSGDGNQISLACPFCGDSQKQNDHGHLSIKLDVGAREPMLYQCFRADCGKKGVLTTDTLQLLGCTDMETLLELANHNADADVRMEKGFNVKSARNYEMVNLSISDNREKLKYVNRRLGTDFDYGDLRNFRIQLGLYEFLNLNGIRRLAFKQSFCDLIDQYCIGFMSMYRDYLICRDITKEQMTGRRYTMYRISGKPNPTDMKLYAIPGEIKLLEPTPAIINIAEGTFSILGAYLYGGYGHDAVNSVWLANCGSGYQETLLHVVKQYGLTDIRLNIWSDSEIKIKKYELMLKSVQNRMRLTEVNIFYNEKAEDFGQPKKFVKTNRVRLK